MKKQGSTKLFTILFAIILTITLVIASILFYLLYYRDQLIQQTLITFLVGILFIVILTIGLTVYSIHLLNNRKTISNTMEKIMVLSIDIFYPVITIVGRIMAYDKNTIRRAYTILNNQLIYSKKYDIEARDILILSPHCLQKSFCPHKITHDTNNCKRCGKCDVDRLLKLKENYGVKFSIVTGGTLARKIIKDNKPKAIIAIACERDLFSGLMDIRKIPVLAVINQRPEGPCINTAVDIMKVEKAIKHFIKEG